jgi:hypothetical protein
MKIIFLLLAALAALGSAAQTSSTSGQPLPRAEWLKNGLIDAGGTHEPFSFVVRRGGMRLDAFDQYQKAQSESLLRRLKESGVEVFHTHLYKGFGMAAEKAEMEDTRSAVAKAHELGLKADTYIQWNTLMYETFFAEEPRATNWVQRDALGQPILLTYGYQQAYRYRPCFANQEYLDYLKRIVRYAVEEVKTDFIHFDNFDLNAEPDSCHCPVCGAGFRTFLRAKYTPERLKERLGFTVVDYVNPPVWNSQNPPQKMHIIVDPVIQEWIDYRCQFMADALGQMAAYARSLNPEVAIEVNPHGINGENRAWVAGLDHARFLRYTDAFWSETESDPSYLPEGQLLSRIRSYKLARCFQNILICYLGRSSIAPAEALAFNQTLGYLGGIPRDATTLRYLNFYREHRELFYQTRDVANVAVFRSYPSITYHNERAQLSAIQLEQVLIQSRIPFDLVFDEHLADLSKYAAVILPDSECMTDAQVKQVRSFVERGGGLVVTGRSGVYDEWHRVRVHPGLEGLVDGQRGTEYQEQVPSLANVRSEPSRKSFGDGRVIYYPTVPFDGPMPESEAYGRIGFRFWKRPPNWAELVEGIRWAAKDSLPLEVSGPPYLAANLVAQPDQHRLILHLVNYNATKVASIESVKVDCRVPAAAGQPRITLFSPDASESKTLTGQPSASSVTFTIPEVKTYSAIEITW